MQLIVAVWNLVKLVVPLVIAYYIMSGLGAFDARPAKIVVQHSSPPVDGFGARSDVPDDVRYAAEVALERHYDQHVYPVTQCAGRDIDGEYLVRCYPMDDEGTPGGLFVIKGAVPRLFSVWPINGKAQQHVRDEDLPKTNDRWIEVRQWQGTPINIEFALKTIR